jgi:hypothetical protein
MMAYKKYKMLIEYAPKTEFIDLDKDKSPTSDEPIQKSSKAIKNINSDYYQKTKERRKKNYQDKKDKITENNKLKKEERRQYYKLKWLTIKFATEILHSFLRFKF